MGQLLKHCYRLPLDIQSSCSINTYILMFHAVLAPYPFSIFNELDVVFNLKRRKVYFAHSGACCWFLLAPDECLMASTCRESAWCGKKPGRLRVRLPLWFFFSFLILIYSFLMKYILLTASPSLTLPYSSLSSPPDLLLPTLQPPVFPQKGAGLLGTSMPGRIN